MVERADGELLMVEPHQTKENFVDFMRYVQADSSLPSLTPSEVRNVKYAQTRGCPT